MAASAPPRVASYRPALTTPPRPRLGHRSRCPAPRIPKKAWPESGAESGGAMIRPRPVRSHRVPPPSPPWSSGPCSPSRGRSGTPGGSEMTTEFRLSHGAPIPPRRGLPEAAVKRGRRRFSVVWLVPLVAAAVAVWLAVTTLREQGPTVSLVFKTAEGLEAGKTKVRYKDIDVGTVKDVRLSDDLREVVAVAELRKQAEPFMTEGTRWWVVRP